MTRVTTARPLPVTNMGCLPRICFHVGRLTGSKGSVWQYTAIDVASAYTWAELHVTPRNPSAKWTSRLARRVASDLAARGWELKTVLTDNGSEFRSRQFGEMVAALGAGQRFIHAGRPQTNGCVERVQGTPWPSSPGSPSVRHAAPREPAIRSPVHRSLHLSRSLRPGRPARGAAVDAGAGVGSGVGVAMSGWVLPTQDDS